MLLQVLQFLNKQVEDALVVLTVGLKFSLELLDLANDPVDPVISTLTCWTVHSRTTLEAQIEWMRDVHIIFYFAGWTRRFGPTRPISHS